MVHLNPNRIQFVCSHLCIVLCCVVLNKENIALASAKGDDASGRFRQFWGQGTTTAATANESFSPLLTSRGGGGNGLNKKNGKISISQERKSKESKETKKSEGEEEPKKTSVTSAMAITSLFKKGLKVFLGATVVLYVLNQKHMLPKPLSSKVSRTLFWPTLPITISRRFGKWCTIVDDNVVLGGLPLGFANYPENLYKNYNVRGVINMCEEYHGPMHKYKKLGIEELHLPTTDHFEPTVEDMKKAVDFIEKFEDKKERVYVHCRAGHGRSAAVVFAYLMKKNPQKDLKQLNEDLFQLRDVRKKLWKQKNILQFRSYLKLEKKD